MSTLYQINTNIQALNSFSSLKNTNSDLGSRQLRLATGNRINRAEEDSAGYSIAKKLEAKTRGQAQALQNITDAKSMLTVAEGSMNSVMDILQTMKEKAIQAANDSMGTNERTAIQSQLDELAGEINDISNTTEFNGKTLLDGTYSASSSGSNLQFQVGVATTQSDTFTVNLATISAGELGGTTMTINALDVEGTATTRAQSIEAIDNAIQSLSDRLGTIGDKQKRLSFKSENLETARTNYESARSGIMDADFAKEQMEITKLQILQQTGTASLAQANAASQSVLSLL